MAIKVPWISRATTQRWVILQASLALGAPAFVAACGDATGRPAADTADTGDGSDTGDGPDDEPTGEPSWDGCEPDAPAAALRRLTRAQYGRTVRDLLDRDVPGLDDFVADEKVGAFDTNLSAPVSEVAVEDYMNAAETLAADVVEDLATLVSCDLGDAGCPEEFVRRFGAQAYRRPLDQDEVDRALTLFDTAQTPEDGARLVVQGMLQSPYFLYHVELGVPPSGDQEVVPLTDHELASRLSYFLWGSMPDDELREVADSGMMHDSDMLETQVARMLEDERAADAIGSFHLQWTGVDALLDVSKEVEVWEPLSQSMMEEVERFSNWVIFDDDARLATLLSAPTGFADGALADLYGVELPADADPADFTRVEFDPEQRRGLLTLAGVLARHAHGTDSAPVQRGKLVRENLLLCGPLPPPPPEVNDDPGSLDPNLPPKERYEQHREDPSCAGCHDLMDPIGFGFEHYDGLGAYRTAYTLGNGDTAPVDATGELLGTDIDGQFADAIELNERLATSSSVQACVVQQWMQFGLNRVPGTEDTCVHEALVENFADNDGDIRTMIKHFATSTAMRYIRVGGGD